MKFFRHSMRNLVAAIIAAVIFVITQPLHAAAFDSDALDFRSAFIKGPVDPDESVILQGEFRTTSSTGVGDFKSVSIQLSLPTVSDGQFKGNSSFYGLDISTSEQYMSNLETKLRALAGNQSITLPIAKLDPIKPKESGGFSFEIDIVRIVVNSGLVINPDGSFSTSISFLPAGDLPASFKVGELKPNINYGLFIGAYDPGGILSFVDFRVNAIRMSAAFGARPNTKVYTLTGDLSLDSNGNRVVSHKEK